MSPLLPRDAEKIQVLLGHPEYIRGDLEPRWLDMDGFRRGVHAYFEMRKGVRFYGRVTFDDGTPIMNARVIVGINARHWFKADQLTDCDGAYEFRNIAPGRHSVSVYRGSRLLERSELDLDEDTAVNFVVPRAKLK